jgi:hypothetical protein
MHERHAVLLLGSKTRHLTPDAATEEVKMAESASEEDPAENGRA